MTSESGFAKSVEDEVKKARFSEQQIIEILKLPEASTKVADLCRKHRISQWTFYQRRNQYGGMGVSEAKRLKELEEENRRLKKIVADQALDVSERHSAESGNARGEANGGALLAGGVGLSERRACG
jgi:putative transposase